MKKYLLAVLVLLGIGTGLFAPLSEAAVIIDRPGNCASVTAGTTRCRWSVPANFASQGIKMLEILIPEWCWKSGYHGIYSPRVIAGTLKSMGVEYHHFFNPAPGAQAPLYTLPSLPISNVTEFRVEINQPRRCVETTRLRYFN